MGITEINASVIHLIYPQNNYFFSHNSNSFTELAKNKLFTSKGFGQRSIGPIETIIKLRVIRMIHLSFGNKDF